MGRNNDWINNIVDEDFLQDNLTFVSLFIAVYENFTDYVVSNIEFLLCEETIENGEIVIKKTEIYQDEIKNRIVDNKKNKDITKASFLWLKDNNAISSDDYDLFLKIKSIRNKYAHELINIILSGVDGKEEVKAFFEMIALYKKITKWWFINVESAIIGYETNENEEICNLANEALDVIIDVLYNGKAEEYKKIIRDLKKGNKMCI